MKPKTPSEPKGTPGARPGHPGHHQVLLEPTEVIVVRPPACGCGQTAFPDARPYYTHQVIELPDIQMIVRHFVLIPAHCSRCGKVTKAPVPPVASSGYGPRFTALLGELSGSQRGSRSAVQEFCRSVLGVPISQGAIQRAVVRVSEALKPYYEAIAVQARRAPVAPIGTTGTTPSHNTGPPARWRGAYGWRRPECLLIASTSPRPIRRYVLAHGTMGRASSLARTLPADFRRRRRPRPRVAVSHSVRRDVRLR